MFSTVHYNTDAARYIRAAGLADGVGLQKIISDGTIDPQSKVIDLPHFPQTSVIVKEIWEGFSVNADGSSKDLGQPEIAVDVPAQRQFVDPGSKSGKLAAVGNWKTVAKLKLDSSQTIDVKTQCPSGGINLEQPVPIQCFYHIYQNKSCDLSTTPPTVVNGAPAKYLPCYLVLVGFQVATAETANWTWTTFWWANNPSNATPYFDGQPDQLDQRFQHYAMNATYGPQPGDNTELPPVFNPYLEGPNGRGTLSNCFSCHNGAAYVPNCTVGPNNASCKNQQTAQPVLGTPVNLQPCTVTQTGQSRVDKNCALKTDHLWSLAANQDVLTRNPL